MKKTVALLLCIIMVLTFTACSENKTENKGLKIGIIQYMSHPSLDNCYEGIISAINESDIECSIDHQTGSSSSADADCTNYAKNMVASGYDMIIAIATPAAKSAFAATDDTDIPVIFCAVSDPLAANLVESMEKPGYLCTGTSDVLDLDAQVNLIKSILQNVKSIGVLYTSSEDNSITNLRNFRAVCEEAGVEVVATAVQNGSDIPTAAEELASKVDCINNFTDNNVVNNLSVVLSAADKYEIPVFGSEIEQVSNGCVASVSIDYVALGKVTGEMAVAVLKGEDASTMAVKTISDATPVINKTVVEKLGLSMPEGYADMQIIE